jgi:lipoprotein-anchoring transpeptidase ErfK/SrfK
MVMHTQIRWQFRFLILSIFITLGGCATGVSQAHNPNDLTAYNNDTGLPLYRGQAPYSSNFNESKFASLLPSNVDTQEKVIVVDPKVFAWGAYDEHGQLVRAGIATAGADTCQDEGGKPCRTHSGSFRIFSMGNEDCISHQYPVGKGGSLMPYCMFFNNGQSLHGSPDQMMTEANISHGCVHMRIPDAEWLRYNFAKVGTKVIVLPYE